MMFPKMLHATVHYIFINLIHVNSSYIYIYIYIYSTMLILLHYFYCAYKFVKTFVPNIF